MASSRYRANEDDHPQSSSKELDLTILNLCSVDKAGNASATCVSLRYKTPCLEIYMSLTNTMLLNLISISVNNLIYRNVRT
jgi:hypothetical protein